jgi:hypothetical protein
MFTTHYDTAGKYVSTITGGGSRGDYGSVNSISASGELLIGGSYTTRAFFNKGPDSVILTSSNLNLGLDIFLLKYGACNSGNTGVNQTGAMLTADASGVSYQWVDCDKGYIPLAGETYKSFTAVRNGRYAVIIKDGNCADTSACYSVTGLRVTGGAQSQQFDARIYPSPSTGLLTIDHIPAGTILTVYNPLGALIYTQEAQSIQTTVDVSHLIDGVYLIRFRYPDGSAKGIPFLRCSN